MSLNRECLFPPIGRVEVETRRDATHFTLYLQEDNDNPIGFIRLEQPERDAEFTAAIGAFYNSLLQGAKAKAPITISG